MNKLSTTIVAVTIAASSIMMGLPRDAFADETTLAAFTVTGEVPPIDAKTNKPVQMTATTEEKITEYIVVEGDTLDKIAEVFELDKETLQQWNNLIGEFLEVGQVLSVSGQVEPTEEQRIALEAAKKAEEEKKRAQNILDFAYQYMGVPYVFGGTTPSGFDCSGYVSYVFKKVGILSEHHNAAGLYAISEKVETPKVGDLVFFSGTYKAGISHVGIYIGNDQMINASGKKVQITTIHDAYWRKHFTGYGRI